MAETLEIVIRATDKTAGALKTTRGDVAGLEKETKSASQRMVSAFKQIGAAAATGLIVRSAVQFGKASYDAAARVEQLGVATENLAKQMGSSRNAMVSAMQAASKGTVDEMAALEAANKAMMFGIVQTEGEMAELTSIAITLGSAMGMTAKRSVDDLTTALGRNSYQILDNLGISLKQADAERRYAASIGKTVDQLTEEEKAQAFRAAAMIEGRKRMEELGGITETNALKAERLDAAWADFHITFGRLLQVIGGGIDPITRFVNKLSEGAEAWGYVIEVAAPAIAQYLGLAKAEDMATQASQARASALYTQLIPAEYSLAQAMLNTEQAIIRRTGAMTQEMERYIPFAQERADAIIEGLNEEKLAAEDTAEAVAQAVENQILAYQNLQSGYADYVLGVQGLQEGLRAGQASTASSIAAAEAQANEGRAAAGVRLTEQLVKNEEDRADAIHRVMEGAHARSAEQNAADLQWWNDIYDQKETDLRAAYDEQNAAIDEKLTERTSALATADANRAGKEKEAMDDLKLLAALTVMETSGELVKFTGGMATSAEEAAKLIEAGILPVTDTMATKLGRVISGLDTQATTMTRQQGVNATTMEGVFTGAFARTTTLAEAMGATGFTTGTKVASGFEAAQSAAGQLKVAYDDFLTTFEDTITAMPAVVEAIKWDEVGENILLGIKEGVEEKRGELLEAIRQTGEEAYRVMMESIQAQSASKKFMKVGLAIAQGVAVGIENSATFISDAGRTVLDRSFKSWLSFMKLELGKGSGELKQMLWKLTDKTLNYLVVRSGETAGEAMQRALDKIIGQVAAFSPRIAKHLALSQGTLFEMLGEQAGTVVGFGGGEKFAALMSAAGVFGGLGGTAGSLLQERRLGPIQETIRALEEQLALMQEQGASLEDQAKVVKALKEERKEAASIERDMAALAKQQADLQFIQQQSNLIQMIKDNGLNVKNILGGLKLGLDADLQGLIQAMTRAMQAMIGAAEKELGIASHSKKGFALGRNFIEAMGIGALEAVPATAMAMGGAAGQVTNIKNYYFEPHYSTRQSPSSLMHDIAVLRVMEG